MHFAFDDDTVALSQAVASLLEKRAGIDLLRAAWSDPAAPELAALWTELAAMGATGLLAPGSGFGWVQAAAVLAECGRVALPLPVVETTVAVAAGAADGAECASAAPSATEPFPAASRSVRFLAGPRLYARDEVELEPVASVDRTRDTARLHPRAGSGAGVTAPVGSFGALASAAFLVGLGRALVDMTVGYVKERRQFGVPVGSFQAVKHQLADATLHVEFAAPAVWAAAWELDSGVASWDRSASMAKALASDAASRAARAALQCHGAMGYTDEYHLHFWLKRVWCLSAAWGTARQHRALLARRFGLLEQGE